MSQKYHVSAEGLTLKNRMEVIQRDIIDTATALSNGLGADFTYLEASVSDVSYDLKRLQDYYGEQQYSFRNTLPIYMTGLEGSMARLRSTWL